MLGLLRKYKISKYTDNYLSEKESTFLNYLFENFERSNLSYLLHERGFFCFNKNDNFIFLYLKDLNNKTHTYYTKKYEKVLKYLKFIFELRNMNQIISFYISQIFYSR